MSFRSLLLLRLLVISVMGLSTACALQETPPSKPLGEGVLKPKAWEAKRLDFFGPVITLGGDRDVYLIWASIESAGAQKLFDLFFSRSQTDGGTWLSPAVSLKPDSSRTTGARHLLADEKGNVYSLWGAGLRTTGRRVVFTRSEDRGASWRGPFAIDSPNELHPPGLIRDPRGLLYAVMPYGPESNWNLAFARSSDGGKSWEGLPSLVNALGPRTFLGIRNPVVVADEQGRLHVVWEERDEPAKEKIFYNRFTPSTGAGGSWLSQAVQLSAGGAASYGAIRPQVNIDREGHLFVVWVEAWDPQLVDFREGRLPQAVYFNRSMDSGESWLSEPRRLSQSGPGSIKLVATWVDVANNGRGQVYVVWKEEEGYPRTERIVFAHSPDYGSTWASESQRLHQGPQKSFIAEPFHMRSGGADNVYLLWQEVGGPSWNLFFTRSSDRGRSWLPKPVRLASLPQANRGAHGLSFDTNGRSLYVAWEGGPKESNEIFVNHSMDFGVTWLPEEIQVSRR